MLRSLQESINPPVQLDFLATKYGTVTVVRDDLLKGGTKQRAAVPYLNDLLKNGIKEIVYASPFSGYAQVALAEACKIVGINCTIFACSENGAISKFSQLAKNSGAFVVLSDSLEEAEKQSVLYDVKNKFKIPLGFNDPFYKNHLRESLAEQWKLICQKLGYTPSALWVPVGSGTLAETFRSVVPLFTKLICVDVRVLPTTDERILKIKELANSAYLSAPELFQDSSFLVPPIPSNRYYDAKLWQFVSTRASSLDVWWNVA